MPPNPYYGQNLWGFFVVFMERLTTFLSGRLSIQDLTSDEIQIAVLVAVSLSSAITGTFLVLRRMTMLANSLSHTILVGIVMAYVLFSSFTEDNSGSRSVPMQAMLVASLLMGFLTTFLTDFFTRVGKMQRDASTGLVFTSLFALGVILVTMLTRNAHIGTEAIMGNADALHHEDLFLAYLVALFNIVLFYLFFKEYFITTFDPSLASSLGISTAFFNYLLMAQVSATTIASFRAVGVLLVLAFMTGPVLTARLVTHRLTHLLFISAGLGMLSSWLGVAAARHMLTVYGIALSTAGVVVCLIVILYLIFLTCKWMYSYGMKMFGWVLSPPSPSTSFRKEGERV
jgi:manganese/zinc/iron transport system permease protein